MYKSLLWPPWTCFAGNDGKQHTIEDHHLTYQAPHSSYKFKQFTGRSIHIASPATQFHVCALHSTIDYEGHHAVKQLVALTCIFA